MGVVEIGLVQAFGASSRRGADYLREVAQAAERLGFHSLWSPEHIVFLEQYESVYPYPPEPGSHDAPQLPVGRRPGLYDPLLACQAVAMHTTTLRVGTAIALLPLRHPLLWAREIATVDHLSGGRFELGVGVGWLREEFDALGVSFADRGSLADEHLAALRAVWTEEIAAFHGRHVDFAGVLSFPKPLQQPGPPIVIGGESDAALRRVARYGDGWFGWNMTPAELGDRLAVLDDHLERERFVDGRRRTRSDVTIQVGLRSDRSPTEVAELVDGYAAAGATRVVMALPLPAEGAADQLASVAESLGLTPPVTAAASTGHG